MEDKQMVLIHHKSRVIHQLTKYKDGVFQEFRTECGKNNGYYAGGNYADINNFDIMPYIKAKEQYKESRMCKACCPLSLQVSSCNEMKLKAFEAFLAKANSGELYVNGRTIESALSDLNLELTGIEVLWGRGTK